MPRTQFEHLMDREFAESALVSNYQLDNVAAVAADVVDTEVVTAVEEVDATDRLIVETADALVRDHAIVDVIVVAIVVAIAAVTAVVTGAVTVAVRENARVRDLVPHRNVIAHAQKVDPALVAVLAVALLPRAIKHEDEAYSAGLRLESQL